MEERLKVKVAVFAVMKRGDTYFLMRRANTGFRDGFYTLPSGHVEVGEQPTEGLVREVQEEAGVRVRPDQLKFVHAMYNTDRYADYYFQIEDWEGEPSNSEPEKCDEVRWGTIEELEEHIVPKVKLALENIEAGIPFSEIEMK